MWRKHSYCWHLRLQEGAPFSVAPKSCFQGSSRFNQRLGQDLADNSRLQATGHLRSLDPHIRDQDVLSLHPAGHSSARGHATSEGLGAWIYFVSISSLLFFVFAASKRHPREDSESKALFNFLAELCWANYMCPSEHAIQKAMHCLLDTAWALTECGNSEPAGWYSDPTRR